MTGKKSKTTPRTKPRDQKTGKGAEATGPLLSPAAIRETIESIVIAFILAFLFRTFEAEAFVIPTGSMAPTLMGRHKDPVCPECGYQYPVSASEEVDQDSNELRGFLVESSTCPMCRYTMLLTPDNPQGKDYPSFKGDRILVGKFPYELHDPDRWDVAVFRYPAQAHINFIKRIVGLPNETIRIRHGDLLVKGKDDKEFTIARKPPSKLLAMLQLVHDNNYVPPVLTELGWPARWQPWPTGGKPAPGSFATTSDPRWFETSGTPSGETWIRYQHILPSYEDWQQIERGRMPAGIAPRPQLVTDFCAYNTGKEQQQQRSLHDPTPTPESLGLHWVGDLAVECDLDVQGSTGEAVVELVKGGRRFQCRFDLAGGKATLSISGMPKFRPAAQTALTGPGRHRVRFANVDEQLFLWVDNSFVQFDAATTYPNLNNSIPTADDLAPVGIGARGAAVRVGGLRVLRDVYYIATRDGVMNLITDYDTQLPPFPLTRESLAQFLSTPAEWVSGPAHASPFEHLQTVDMGPLGDDQFLVLGDNSPRSKDSRLWSSTEYYVKRDLLIGEALFIYWPHAWPTPWSIQLGPFRVPFYPDFRRFGLVR